MRSTIALLALCLIAGGCASRSPLVLGIAGHQQDVLTATRALAPDIEYRLVTDRATGAVEVRVAEEDFPEAKARVERLVRERNLTVRVKRELSPHPEWVAYQDGRVIGVADR